MFCCLGFGFFFPFKFQRRCRFYRRFAGCARHCEGPGGTRPTTPAAPRAPRPAAPPSSHRPAGAAAAALSANGGRAGTGAPAASRADWLPALAPSARPGRCLEPGHPLAAPTYRRHGTGRGIGVGTERGQSGDLRWMWRKTRKGGRGEKMLEGWGGRDKVGDKGKKRREEGRRGKKEKK